MKNLIKMNCVADASTDAAASCLELVPVRTMYDYGYSVATGNFSMKKMEVCVFVCVCVCV